MQRFMMIASSTNDADIGDEVRTTLSEFIEESGHHVKILTRYPEDPADTVLFEAPSRRVAHLTAAALDSIPNLEVSLWEIDGHSLALMKAEDVTRDQVTRASRQSFPASDPPAWTPTTGMTDPN